MQTLVTIPFLSVDSSCWNCNDGDWKAIYGVNSILRVDGQQALTLSLVFVILSINNLIRPTRFHSIARYNEI